VVIEVNIFNRVKMDIDEKLVPILKDVDFAFRYKSLCEKYSDFDHRLIDYDVQRIKVFYESVGLIVSFSKKENFFKTIEKAGAYGIQLNTIPKRGFVQFVLDLKFGEERIKLGWGMWESITGELIEKEFTAKPIFTSYEELEDILKEGSAIYEDIKRELLKT
jgi:hypothetical protein